LRLIVDSFSFPGINRENQDSILINIENEAKCVLAIADGMGGESGGGLASKVTIEEINRLYNKDDLSIKDIYKLAHEKLKTISHDPLHNKMGTTLTMCVIKENIIQLGHVGDSRLYHVHDNEISIKTKDQTELQRLIDDGILTERRAINYKRAHVLLSVLSPSSDYILQENEFVVKNKDRILLMTDGAYNLITKDKILDISLTSDKPSELLYKLKHEIEIRKPTDDYSVICAEIT